MKIYFSLKSIPEFQDLSRPQLLRKYRFYYVKSFGHWGQWLGLSLAIFFLSAGLWFSGIGRFIFAWFAILLGGMIYQVCVLGTIAYLSREDLNR